MNKILIDALERIAHGSWNEEEMNEIAAKALASYALESGGEEKDSWEEMKSMIRAADKAYVPLNIWVKLKERFSLRLKQPLKIN